MSRITRTQLELMASELSTSQGVAQLMAGCPWLTEARAQSMPAGCMGLLAVMEHLGVEQVLVSDRDLLDGLLAEMLHS